MPFAPVTGRGMFDYATGKWAPVRFENYVTKEVTTSPLSADVRIPRRPAHPRASGRGYGQIAREGWGEQKSQNGGGNPTLSSSFDSEYHRWATTVEGLKGQQTSFFAGMDTSIPGLASLVPSPAPEWLTTGLKEIAARVSESQKSYAAAHPETIAPALESRPLWRRQPYGSM